MFIPPPPADPNPPAQSSPTIDDLVAYVHDCLNKGSQPEEIRKHLIALDYPPELANEVVHRVLTMLALNAGVAPPPAPIPSGGKKKKGKKKGAAAVVSNQSISLYRQEKVLLDQLGRRNMLFGGMWFVGGLIVTLGTMAMVSEGGGRFVIAWGAVIWGAIQFIRGKTQVNAAQQMR
ncbi:MAG: hypothetical protein L0Y72_24260 [Gemmataceae bacterium]|nr:hypothetical protein [Gemmataceae bacterium]MCI0742160.1 hypothetical protein [Gemmataceae bacterium]